LLSDGDYELTKFFISSISASEYVYDVWTSYNSSTKVTTNSGTTLGNELGIANAFVQGFNTLSDIAYNTETPLSDNRIYDVAMRGTAQDRHVENQLYDLFATGNGLWGESSREREIKDAVNYARNSGTDFSNMYSRDGSIDTLINAWNPNLIQGYVDVPENTYDNIRRFNYHILKRSGLNISLELFKERINIDYIYASYLSKILLIYEKYKVFLPVYKKGSFLYD
jgi:hypothetical protein